MENSRKQLQQAKRIIVKVGSRVLVDETGKPDHERISSLVKGLSAAHHEGHEITLVSSGAIAAGLEALGLETRPDSLPGLQMAASVGQTRLMSLYSQLFTESHIQTGQILLTDDLLKIEERQINAKNTLLQLIEHRIIPVINENDTVATEEITFGDNDLLAALVSILIDADALILLTTTDGLHDEHGVRVPFINKMSDDILALDRGSNGHLSTGGMTSKLLAADQASKEGAIVLIADGQVDGVLQSALAGDNIGTLINSAKRD